MPKHQHMDGETPGHWPRSMPFRVPDNYFDEQRREILAALDHEWSSHSPETARREIDRISPLLGELKRNGVNGRWNVSRPAIDVRQTDTDKTETAEIVQPASVRRMSRKRWWAAAAVAAGLWLTIQLVTDRPVDADTIAAGNTPIDSIAFSTEEISAFLAENGAFSPETDQNAASTSGSEQFLASADLLAIPEGLAEQMEAIPVHELEAYINDISPKVE